MSISSSMLGFKISECQIEQVLLYVNMKEEHVVALRCGADLSWEYMIDCNPFEVEEDCLMNNYMG